MSLNDKMFAKGYVPVKKVAELVGIHVSTVYRMLDQAELVGIRVGKVRYVKIKSVISYLGQDAARLLGLIEPRDAEVSDGD